MHKALVTSVMLIVFGTAVAAAAPTPVTTASHSVVVEVKEIHCIAVTGGDVCLVIQAAAAGQAPAPVTDTSTALSYTINSNAAQKITAQLDRAYPDGVQLQVAVSDPHATGKQTLGTVAVDVVTNLSKVANPTAALAYTATAQAGAGELNETRTVTYTIVEN